MFFFGRFVGENSAQIDRFTFFISSFKSQVTAETKFQKIKKNQKKIKKKSKKNKKISKKYQKNIKKISKNTLKSHRTH